MRDELQSAIKELIQYSAEQSAADEACEPLEALAKGDDEGAEVWAVVLLRLRTGSYAINTQAQYLRQLVDEGDLAAAMDCVHMMSSLCYGFYEGARSVTAMFLPKYLP